MAELVYILCVTTSVFCAFLLFRSYRRNRSRLLLLSTLCFVGLALNSIVLLVDLMILPNIDLRLLRTVPALIATFGFLVGLIWESR